MTAEEARQATEAARGIVRLRVHVTSQIVTPADAEPFIIMGIWPVNTFRIDRYMTLAGALERIAHERAAAENDALVQAQWIVVQRSAELAQRERGAT